MAKEQHTYKVQYVTKGKTKTATVQASNLNEACAKVESFSSVDDVVGGKIVK